MATFIVMTRDFSGSVNIYPVTAANLTAAQNGVQNLLAAQLLTGLPKDPLTGQPDTAIAVRSAGLAGQTGQNVGETLIGIVNVASGTKCIPGATSGNPITGWA